ncbi:MAG TPA: FeoA family protein [Gemmatimonadaceae bacterium]|nr:FeoA family protein [Gemmatimonadaceae bacterium]
MARLTDTRRVRKQVAPIVFRFLRIRPSGPKSTTAASVPLPLPSPAACTLGACPVGLQATVLCLACPAHDAQRLRALGMFEGARVGVLDTRSGMVVDVRGARLALGREIAASITVRPVAP